MRAFMSDLDTRWDQDDEIASWEETHSTVLGFENGKTVLARLALAEARRILAETEPKPIELHRHVKVGATVYLYEDEAQTALAEALTQWLSSDDGQE